MSELTPWLCQPCAGADYQPPPRPVARCAKCQARPDTHEVADMVLAMLEKVAAALARVDPTTGAKTPAPRLLTVDEAGQALGCKRTRVFDLITQGALERRRLGKRVMITAESVEACLAEQTARSARAAPKKDYAAELEKIDRVILKKRK